MSSTLSVTGPATAKHGDTVTFSGTLGSNTVTYQVSYAGDAHLAASSASASVTAVNTDS